MSTGAIIGIVFGIIAFIALVAFLARLASPKAKGDRGEAFIANILQQYVNEVGGFLINDVILPYGKATQQIDHIVFAPAGVFVVETKNWAGNIYGKDEDNDWTQIMGYKYLRKHQHYNPVKQNYVHVKAVRVHTKEYEKGEFFNVVVFTKNNTENISSKYVVGSSELLNCLRSFKEKQYTLDHLRRMYDRIRYYIDHPVSTHDQHVMSVRQDHPVL